MRTAALGRVWPGDGCVRWLSRVFEAEVHCALEAFVAVAEVSPGQSLREITWGGGGGPGWVSWAIRGGGGRRCLERRCHIVVRLVADVVVLEAVVAQLRPHAILSECEFVSIRDPMSLKGLRPAITGTAVTECHMSQQLLSFPCAAGAREGGSAPLASAQEASKTISAICP